MISELTASSPFLTQTKIHSIKPSSSTHDKPFKIYLLLQERIMSNVPVSNILFIWYLTNQIPVPIEICMNQIYYFFSYIYLLVMKLSDLVKNICRCPDLNLFMYLNVSTAIKIDFDSKDRVKFINGFGIWLFTPTGNGIR